MPKFLPRRRARTEQALDLSPKLSLRLWIVLLFGFAFVCTLPFSTFGQAPDVGHTCVYNCGGSEPSYQQQPSQRSSAPSSANPYSGPMNQMSNAAAGQLGRALGEALRRKKKEMGSHLNI